MLVDFLFGVQRYEKNREQVYKLPHFFLYNYQIIHARRNNAKIEFAMASVQSGKHIRSFRQSHAVVMTFTYGRKDDCVRLYSILRPYVSVITYDRLSYPITATPSSRSSRRTGLPCVNRTHGHSHNSRRPHIFHGQGSSIPPRTHIRRSSRPCSQFRSK